MPTVEIITGPAGSGKSVACRARLLERPDTWLILPSEQRRVRWQCDLPGARARIKTVHDLARELAAPVLEGREVVTPAFRLLILGQVIAQAVSPESYLGRVAETPGFARCLADLLSQLRQGEANAEALAAAVSAAAPHLPDGTFSRKGEEFAALQHRYEAYLREHRLLDVEDLLALAAGRAREADEYQNWPSEIMADGFTEFTSLQLSLFEALAPRVDRLSVTLTHDASRPVLFAHSAEALQRLVARFPGALIRELSAPDHEPPAGGLRLLERRLFRGEPPAPLPDDSLRLLEAPDGLMQVEMVAREVRRLLDHQGYRPGEICLLLRSIAGLAPVIKNVFARYHVPVWLHVGERLGDNPFIACLSTLLRLWQRDWQREDLLRLLRSSYLGLSRFAVDALERRARRAGLRHGRARWLRVASSDEVGEELTAVLCRLADWQDRLHEARAPAALRGLLEEALADLGLLAGVRRGEALLVQEDLRAWDSALHILDDLSRLDRLSGERPWRFEEFASTAMAGWDAGFYNLPANEEDRVRVLELFDTSGHDFRSAFLLDLVEGAFPRRAREDPCFRDDERQALALHGGVALPLSLARADEERLLFYQAITAPRERLFLCYPKTDEGGRVTLRSFFLDEVEQAVAPLPVKSLTLAHLVAEPEDAVLPCERLAYLAAALGDGERPDAGDAPAPLRELCAALREELPWETERLLAAPEARRSYHLLQPAVRARWEGRRRAYTVSELESARACPFQHFLGYRLRLDTSQEGAEPLEIGKVLHEALRRFFSENRGRDFPGPEEAVARLQTLCRAQFEQTPLDARPYRVRLAEGALLRYLEGFVQRELEYRDATRLEPSLFEFAFGPQAESDDVETGSGVGESEEPSAAGPDPAPTPDTLHPTPSPVRGPTDAASTRRPLLLRSGSAEVRLSGKIDRIDRTADGHALVFDYKLGKPRSVSEMQEGRSLQMPVYWLAVEQLLGLTIVGGAYDALREGRRPIIARCDWADHAFTHKGILGKNALGKAPFEQLLDRAQAAVFETVALIERLEVAPSPMEAKTCSFCRYQDCCRPEDAGVAFDREAEGGEADE